MGRHLLFLVDVRPCSSCLFDIFTNMHERFADGFDHTPKQQLTPMNNRLSPMIDKLRAISSIRFASMTRSVPALSSLPAFLGGQRVGLQHASLHRGPRDSHQSVGANLTDQTPNQQLLDIISAPPAPQPLLLEGDEFYVSHDGISRTFYELKSWTSDAHLSAPPVSLEEHYDLKRAHKSFIVRRGRHAKKSHSSYNDVLGKNTQGVALLGAPLRVFGLQEIDQGVFGSAGTGATTWESSIAMSLFFSSNPSLLRGDVVELGSGVGFAGILGHLAPTGLSEMESLTLTDGNAEVLEQCERNFKQIKASDVPLRVEKLDWYNFINKKKARGSVRKYDTVLASDCAYLYPDVVALASTMSALCRNDNRSKIHIFGPYNRGALHELVLRLKDDLDMDVVVDWLEMFRYRLKPAQDRMNASFTDVNQDVCPFASKTTAKFLHTTAWHKGSAITKDCSGTGRDLWGVD